MLVLILAPALSAAPSHIYKIGDDVQISLPVFNNNHSKASPLVDCYITVKDPKQNVIVNDQQMTNSSSGIFNYTMDWEVATLSGEYPVSIRCGDTADFGSSSFTILLTPTGEAQLSIFNNPLLIIFTIIAIVLLVMAVYFRIPSLGFLSGFIFTLLGVYVMIYGFNNVTSLYTQAAAGVYLAMGLVFLFTAVFEWWLE